MHLEVGIPRIRQEEASQARLGCFSKDVLLRYNTASQVLGVLDKPEAILHLACLARLEEQEEAGNPSTGTFRTPTSLPSSPSGGEAVTAKKRGDLIWKAVQKPPTPIAGPSAAVATAQAEELGTAPVHGRPSPSGRHRALREAAAAERTPKRLAIVDPASGREIQALRPRGEPSLGASAPASPAPSLGPGLVATQAHLFATGYAALGPGAWPGGAPATPSGKDPPPPPLHAPVLGDATRSANFPVHGIGRRLRESGLPSDPVAESLASASDAPLGSGLNGWRP